MARTPSQCRRRKQSSAGFLSEASRCNSDSMRASPDDDRDHLDLSIKQAIQRQRGKQVRAYVVMALHDDGDISTHTTDQVSRCTNTIFTSDAEERLRIAHKASILHARNDEGYLDRDVIYRPNFEDKSSQEARLDGGNNFMSESQPTETIYDLSRPISALSCGRSSAWQSDLGDIELAHVPTLARSQSGGTNTDHFESLMVCESEKIEHFILEKFRTMQQLAVKRIAKAWIKGICPKKQAHFPYHKKKREREGLDNLTGGVPGWWPDTTRCRFVEPDHIKRDERINLCLHLLRLRPTPEELKEWNNGCVEPHQTHVNKGWTEFLKELAPLGIFDDMREPEGKEQQERQRLLAQIYDLGKKEEEYKNGEIDGDDVFYWTAEKGASINRNRRSWDLVVDDSGTDSYADSAPPSKRVKKGSSATTSAGSPAVIQQKKTHHDDGIQDCKAASSTGYTSRRYAGRSAAPSPQVSWRYHRPLGDPRNTRHIHPKQNQTQKMHEVSHMSQGYSHGSPWVNAPSPAPFSESERQAVSQAFAMDMPTCTLTRRRLQFQPHNYEQAEPQVCSAYVSAQFTQPQFEGVPVTGLYTPPVLSDTPPTAEQIQNNPYLNGYLCQPSGAQTFSATHSNQALQPYIPGPEQCYAIDPADYRHHPEPGHSANQYPSFRHGGPDFQAPARVERGFTGHGSGVGGGAHT